MMNSHLSFVYMMLSPIVYMTLENKMLFSLHECVKDECSLVFLNVLNMNNELI